MTEEDEYEFVDLEPDDPKCTACGLPLKGPVQIANLFCDTCFRRSSTHERKSAEMDSSSITAQRKEIASSMEGRNQAAAGRFFSGPKVKDTSSKLAEIDKSISAQKQEIDSLKTSIQQNISIQNNKIQQKLNLFEKDKINIQNKRIHELEAKINLFEHNIDRYSQTKDEEIEKLKSWVLLGDKEIEKLKSKVSILEDENKHFNENLLSMNGKILKDETTRSKKTIIIIGILGVILAVVVAMEVTGSKISLPSHNDDYPPLPDEAGSENPFPSQDDDPPLPNEIDRFKNKIMDMRKDFPNQYDVYWKMLQNTGSKYLGKILSGSSDNTPLSYLVAGYSGSNKAANCFVSRLAAAYASSDATKHQYIDCGMFTGDRAKLHEEIKSKLKGDNMLIIIKDVDKLDFTVAKLFMTLADSYNMGTSSPQPLIIFTTELPFSYEPSQRLRKEDEGKVGIHFRTEVWAGAHVDLTSALWSRVGGGMILIREEDEMASCNLYV